jgi:hypothetical protein
MCQCGYRIIHADGSPAEPFQPGPQDRDECIAQARERFGNLPVAADDTPAVDWNNWALLRDALTVHPMPKGSIGQLCAMRLQQLVGDQPQGGISRGGRTFIISTNDGHWKVPARGGAGRAESWRAAPVARLPVHRAQRRDRRDQRGGKHRR